MLNEKHQEISDTLFGRLIITLRWKINQLANWRST